MANGKANLGGIWEGYVERACETYAHSGLANLQKMPTPYKIIGEVRSARGFYLKAVPERKAGVDFLGEYGGTPLAMEVKKTSQETRYPFDSWGDQKRGTEQAQREYMDRFNGLRFYMVIFEPLNQVYLVRYQDYAARRAEALAAGKASIPYAWFQQTGALVPWYKRGAVLDFLASVDELEKE